MDIYEFRKEFIEDVKRTAEIDNDGTVASFVDVASNKLTEIEIISEFYPAFYTGVGKRRRKLRVDAYSLDDWDGTLSIIIADFDGKKQGSTITKTGAKTILSRSLAFIDEILNNNLIRNIEISHPAYDLGETIVRNYSNKILKKFKLILITDKFASDRIETLPNSKINDISVEYHIWDINRFYRVCASEEGKQIIEIDFKEYNGKGIECVEAKGVATKDYRCFLCVLSGTLLADIYDKYGSSLLEGNVRAFLSVRGKVNKSIRSTIINPERAPLFFALNNGISATATDIVLENKDGSTYLTYARDLQIVNGGQTTASLSNARFKDKATLDHIFVQMKLTEVESSLAEDLIPQISKSSNSQNKVSEADFFSNHPFHIRLEKISRSKYAPAVDGAQHETLWFYERARGQYSQQQMKMTKAEKKKFTLQNPKSQVINKTYLAKVRNSWGCLPHIVSKGAQANFIKFANDISEQWDKNDTEYNNLYFQESIALTILFKHTEKLVSNQSWYEKGYRANIVTYSIALLSKLLKDQYPQKTLDLIKIWNMQDIPSEITSQLALITKAVFYSITDPNRDTVNVTQWCKREKCWDIVKKLEIKLNTNIEKYLIDLFEKNSDFKDAKKDQKVMNGIEAQIFIVDLGQQYWKDMCIWAMENKLISKIEFKLLKLATSMSSRKMPNSYQSTKLQELRNRLMNEGFRSK